MQKQHISKLLFVGRSLLYAAVLYTAALFVLDWDDISGSKDATVVHSSSSIPSSRAVVSIDTISRNIKAPTISLSEPIQFLTTTIQKVVSVIK